MVFRQVHEYSRTPRPVDLDTDAVPPRQNIESACLAPPEASYHLLVDEHPVRAEEVPSPAPDPGNLDDAHFTTVVGSIDVYLP